MRAIKYSVACLIALVCISCAKRTIQSTPGLHINYFPAYGLPFEKFQKNADYFDMGILVLVYNYQNIEIYQAEKYKEDYYVFENVKFVDKLQSTAELENVKTRVSTDSYKKYKNYSDFMFGTEIDATQNQVTALRAIFIETPQAYKFAINKMPNAPTDVAGFLANVDASNKQHESQVRQEKERVQQEQLARRREAERIAEEQKRQRLVLAQTRPYTAVISCSFGGNQGIATEACFSKDRLKTQLEVRSGKTYRMYQPWEVGQAGTRTNEGIEVLLENRFEITAQNASDSLLLNLKIVKTATREVVYQKSAAKYGVVSARN